MTRRADHRRSKDRPGEKGAPSSPSAPPAPLPPARSAPLPVDRWHRPAVVGAVVALAALAGASAYAGAPATPAVLYCLVLDGGIVAAWLVAACGFGAAPICLLTRRPRDAHPGVGPDVLSGLRRPSPLTVVSAVAVGLGILGLLVLGFGMAGKLNRVSAVVLLAAGWLLNLAWLRRGRRRGWPGAGRPDRGPASGEHIPEPAPERVGHPAWRWLWLLAAPPLAAALIAATVPPGMLWKPEEPHGFDATAYHLQVPREWFEAGRIVPLQHNAFSYFPFGVEVHYLLAMHLKGGPWDGMYLAQLMHVAMTALAVAAACGVANQLTADCRVTTLVGVAYATVPFLGQLGPLAFNEGGLLLYGTLAVGWALIGVRAATRPSAPGGDRRTDERPTGELQGPPADGLVPVRAVAPAVSPVASFVVGGAMAGFASGVKLTGVPLFLLAIPAAALAVLVRRSPRTALKLSAAFAGVGSLVFAPWLVRTWAWCGNPIFPEGTAVFGQAHFTDAQVERWKRAHAAQPEQQPAAARLAAFGREVVGNWQFGYVMLPAGVAAMALAWRRSEARMLALLLFGHAAFWLAMTHLQGRFFVPALPLAATALALVPWDRWAAGRSHGPTGALAALVAVVGGAALWGWWGVHGRLYGALTALTSDTGVDARPAILAADNLDWLERDLWDVFPEDDPSATVTLVGDAQAFWYPLPMSRLRYRTPFDVPQGPEATVVEGYDAAGRGPRTWLRVAPAEVERFAKTYQPFPRVPEAVRRTQAWSADPPLPYVVPPGRSLTGGEK